MSIHLITFVKAVYVFSQGNILILDTQTRTTDVRQEIKDENKKHHYCSENSRAYLVLEKLVCEVINSVSTDRYLFKNKSPDTIKNIKTQINFQKHSESSFLSK